MGRRRGGKPIHGWLVIDKPAGITSSAVVGRVRALTGAAKAGHGGTLDPQATGVLPVALGEATKTVAYAVGGAKVYRFTVRPLGPVAVDRRRRGRGDGGERRPPHRG